MSQSPLPKAFVYRLPSEVLLEVFKAYWDDFGVIDIQVTHVCRLWRQVVQGYSCFWSTLELDILNEKVEQQAAYWLERSGRTPLDIIVSDSSRYSTYTPGREGRKEAELRLARLAKMLEEVMDRWESFSITLEPHDVDLFFRHCSRVTHTPNLKEFQVDAKDTQFWNYGSARAGIIGIPCDHPPCAGASVSAKFARCIPTFRPNFGLAITNLTLHLEDVDPTDAIVPGILRACSNLESLAVDLRSENTFAVTPPTPPITLPHLRHFYISWDAWLDHIIAPLHLPNLVSFDSHRHHYSNMEVNWNTVADLLVTIFQTCRSSLSSIRILGRRYSSTFDGEETQAVPLGAGPTIVLGSLVHCEVHSHGGDRLLRRLILPNIKSLDIADIEFGTAYRLVTSSPQLQTLSFDYIRGGPPSQTPTPTPHMLPELTSLKAVFSTHFLNHLLIPPLDRPRLLVGSSIPRLRTLHLEKVRFGDDALLRCMERWTELESLALRKTHTTDAVLVALSEPAPDADGGVGSKWILPRLSNIEIEHCLNITSAGFISFAASRNGPRVAPDTGGPPQVRGRAWITEPAPEGSRDDVTVHGCRLRYIDEFWDSDSD
ncbi:hypothetical protein BOTBODRAFT_179766 [Botryobasidium botryosum FD-172 SS1]|uniref:F-box domain-containing protein n=1 Tax=Botryobasidium botryosum (strain FD-172 SS1) TaxID=930990 RepID=A0A067LZ65_BOTB1|nr:hypothetical protein BOTBODRAFT_179766 [Botryobasidium botryosum FD-172 SS1]